MSGVILPLVGSNNNNLACFVQIAPSHQQYRDSFVVIFNECARHRYYKLHLKQELKNTNFWKPFRKICEFFKIGKICILNDCMYYSKVRRVRLKKLLMSIKVSSGHWWSRLDLEWTSRRLLCRHLYLSRGRFLTNSRTTTIMSTFFQSEYFLQFSKNLRLQLWKCWIYAFSSICMLGKCWCFVDLM